jgi:glycosyltransferase involved in cell wall biosynthesis
MPAKPPDSVNPVSPGLPPDAAARRAAQRPHLRYVVVSPARNEERYLAETVESMRRQTLKPRRWVLVDDGSSDRTGPMIDEAARGHPWIVALHRPDRGSRQAGSGVVEAFNEGFAVIAAEPWEVVVKLDTDLSFEPDYFERCLAALEDDPQLGIVGGTCCVVKDGAARPEFENEPAYHVRGPTKIYRRECFAAIGGLLKAPGWDTVDLVTAHMLGWTTRTLPDVRVVHHRPTGDAYGAWSNWRKNGLANYVAGYHPVFMACKCAKRLVARRSVAGAVEAAGLWAGFVGGYVRAVPRVGNPAVIRHLRQQQWRALTLRPSLWSTRAGVVRDGSHRGAPWRWRPANSAGPGDGSRSDGADPRRSERGR